MTAPSSGRRAFLSYGWQDNNDLVLRLKGDLQADGWQVWHDMDRISGGDAFTAEIEDGIRWCDVLLAFMGPHSTRRAGGNRHREGKHDRLQKGKRRSTSMRVAMMPP
jgi:hypothetical protein